MRRTTGSIINETAKPIAKGATYLNNTKNKASAANSAKPYSSLRGKDVYKRQMLLYFLGGAAIGTVFCHLLAEKAIWMALLPLGALLCVFLYADLSAEKDMKEKKPSGH